MMGQSVPSAILQILQIWEDWLITPEGCAAIQRNLDNLENLTGTS